MAAAQPSPYYHAILWTGEHVTVYTPEKPRTVGHLVLRTGVKTFADLSKEAHLEIMTLAQKVKSIKPQLDFVIYWTKRDGELLTEILPQRSAGKALNAMDKLSVNKHIFCPEGITDDIKPSVRSTQVARDRQSWQGALTLAPNLPQMEDTKGSWKLEISHLDDAVTMARWGLRQ
ncbi:MAG: hypothetical protein K0U13_00520, partial [Chlamydiae bacterium]|nr:hypothetical protein [Chlamydiota bacterium]